jgi:ribosomal protein L32E
MKKKMMMVLMMMILMMRKLKKSFSEESVRYSSQKYTKIKQEWKRLNSIITN